MKHPAAPILAAILLLLPALYIGSYFALVLPAGKSITIAMPGGRLGARGYRTHYRFADDPFESLQLRQVFWPLEQLDRRIRPRAWGEQLSHYGGGATVLEVPDLSVPAPGTLE